MAEYQRRARAEVDRLRAAGRLPLLVGGSGLYVRAVLDELDFPGTDPASAPGWRRSWPPSARRRCTPGWPPLDPAAAAAILPSNGRRIVRALEVIELTGRPFTAPLPEPQRRTTRRSQSAWTGHRPSSTSGSPGGWTGCGPPASSTRCAALAADGLREGPTASPRAGLRAGAGSSSTAR